MTNMTIKQLLELSGAPTTSNAAKTLLNENPSELNAQLNKMVEQVQQMEVNYKQLVKQHKDEIDEASEVMGYSIARDDGYDDISQSIEKLADEINSLLYELYGDS